MRLRITNNGIKSCNDGATHNNEARLCITGDKIRFGVVAWAAVIGGYI